VSEASDTSANPVAYNTKIEASSNEAGTNASSSEPALDGTS